MTDPDQQPDAAPQPDATPPAPAAPQPDAAPQPADAPRYAPPPGYARPPGYAPPAGYAHPYAVDLARPDDPRTGGIADISMGLGLAAVLTVIVSALYFPAFAAVGALLGIAAVVLGAIGLAKRRRRWTGVTGIVSGAVAVLGALAMLVVAIFGFASEAIGSASAGTGAHSEGGSESPRAASEWPQSLGTGAILFSGDANGVRMVEPRFDAGTEFPIDADTDADRLRIYVDYSCPYCALFEQANGDTLEEVLGTGDALVEIVPLNFLDRVSMGARYSSRASGAMTCIAELQPEAAWAAHRTLLSAEFQPEEGTVGPDDATLISTLDGVAGGLGPEASACIQEARYVDFAQRLNDWVAANPVPGADDPALRVDSTPFIVANGVRYDGDPTDVQAFKAFLAQQGFGTD